MTRANCPQCKKLLIPAYGTGCVLLVGEFPGFEEVKRGVPFVGRTGDVLRA